MASNNNPKILYVFNLREEYEKDYHLVMDALGKINAGVTGAVSASEALDETTSKTFDKIVMDVLLPKGEIEGQYAMPAKRALLESLDVIPCIPSGEVGLSLITAMASSDVSLNKRTQIIVATSTHPYDSLFLKDAKPKALKAGAHTFVHLDGANIHEELVNHFRSPAPFSLQYRYT